VLASLRLLLCWGLTLCSVMLLYSHSLRTDDDLLLTIILAQKRESRRSRSSYMHDLCPIEERVESKE
jgi:heme exporter protein D